MTAKTERRERNWRKIEAVTEMRNTDRRSFKGRYF